MTRHYVIELEVNGGVGFEIYERDRQSTTPHGRRISHGARSELSGSLDAIEEILRGQGVRVERPGANAAGAVFDSAEQAILAYALGRVEGMFDPAIVTSALAKLGVKKG